MVQRLTEAALSEVRETGYADLTIRNVAARAGVAPATAYTYFSSKNHLLTEIFWRKLRALPPAGEDDRPPAARVETVLRDIVALVVAEPELAAGCTSALLGADEDVEALRRRVGAEIRDRLARGLGANAGPAVLSALEFAYAGALMHAAMGAHSYERIGEDLVSTAALIMRGADTSRAQEENT